jgi:hypothetical protein
MDKDASICLIDSIACDNLGSVIRDFGELLLDSNLQNGLMRDIPILNIAYSACRATKAIGDRLFTKKILNFLAELSKVSLEDRQRFVEGLKHDKNRQNDLGQTFLLLIEQADSLDKPKILARLLNHHILGDLSYQDAKRLASIVNRSYIDDLKYLKGFLNGIQPDPDISVSLHNIGLLAFPGLPGAFDEPELHYELNSFGRMLLKYGLVGC